MWLTLDVRDDPELDNKDVHIKLNLLRYLFLYQMMEIKDGFSEWFVLEIPLVFLMKGCYC